MMKPCFPSLQVLFQLYSNLDIEQDPYVVQLRVGNHEKYLKVLSKRRPCCQDQTKRLLPWQPAPTLHVSVTTILYSGTEVMRMKMIFHCRLPQSVALTSNLDAKSWLQVQIGGIFDPCAPSLIMYPKLFFVYGLAWPPERIGQPEALNGR